MSTRDSTDPPPEEKAGRKGDSRSKKGESVPNAEPRSERSGVLAALEAGLMDAWSGLEVLDRDLAFEDDRRADLAAVESTGRAVLVLLAGEESAGTVLSALDLAAFARANAEILARHLGESVDPSLEPRVVVIDPRNDPRLAERLGGLSTSGIDLFSVRTVKSAAGERSYLLPPKTHQSAQPATIEAFLLGLEPPLLGLARPLVDRMARVDQECQAVADRESVVWRLHGTILARIERSGDRLEASFGSRRERFPIRGEDDVDRIVERALERVASGIGEGRSPSNGARAIEAVPEGEPLLTPEEIAAFRE